MIESGAEWQASWDEVAAHLRRPDRVYGAIAFALENDPMRYSQGITEARDSLRVFVTKDAFENREVWVYIHVSSMLRTVTLQWAQVATQTDPDGG
jgi:hypothetical protein